MGPGEDIGLADRVQLQICYDAAQLLSGSQYLKRWTCCWPQSSDFYLSVARLVNGQSLTKAFSYARHSYLKDGESRADTLFNIVELLQQCALILCSAGLTVIAWLA